MKTQKHKNQNSPLEITYKHILPTLLTPVKHFNFLPKTVQSNQISMHTYFMHFFHIPSRGCG